MTPQEYFLVKLAELKAWKAHHGQKRKGSGEPYFSHPEAVARLVRLGGGDSFAIAAAWLHDVLEDTDETITEFPEPVVNTVLKLTHKGDYEGAKMEAIEKLRGSKDALLIKLCDRFHNLTDCTGKQESYANRPSVRKATARLLQIADEYGLADKKVYRRLTKLLEKIECRIEKGKRKKKPSRGSAGYGGC